MCRVALKHLKGAHYYSTGVHQMAKCWVYMQAQASIMSLPVMDAPSIQHTLRKNSAAEKWNGKQASASTQQLSQSISTDDFFKSATQKVPWKFFKVTDYTLHEEWAIIVQSNSASRRMAWMETFMWSWFLYLSFFLYKMKSWGSKRAGCGYGITVMELWVNKRKKHAIVYLLEVPLVFGAQLPQKKQINYPYRNQKTERQE